MPKGPPIVYPQLHDKAWLEAAYARGTLRAISQEIGCRHTAVAKSLKKFGIPSRDQGWKHCDPRVHSRDWLASAVQEKTAVQIARELGVSAQTVYRAAKALGVPLRSGRPKKRKPVTSQ